MNSDAHRTAYLTSLCDGVLGRQGQVMHRVQRTKVLHRRQSAATMSVTVAAVLYPDPRPLPKPFRKALSHSHTRKVVAHKLNAYSQGL